ncbi:MAG: hypothetical protein ACTS9Y_01670 [Methylophilus sp.]|uniref:hypothetical protein n=1 Tax=Methylophilus sp. TaxID=29541 RepID=UPI003F9FECC9
MLNLFLILLTFALAGCQSLSYQEPTSGDRARVRFATNTESITVLYGYEDAACTINEQEWIKLRTGVLVNSNPKSLGIPLNHHNKNAAKEVFVTTNKPLHFLFRGAVISRPIGKDNIRYCGNAFSYQFEKDKDYEVFFDWDEQEDSCKTTISHIVANPETITLMQSSSAADLDKNLECYESLIKGRW